MRDLCALITAFATTKSNLREDYHIGPTLRLEETPLIPQVDYGTEISYNHGDSLPHINFKRLNGIGLFRRNIKPPFWKMSSSR